MRLSSLEPLFLATAFTQHLRHIDTMPAYEANPVTLYVWRQIGFFSAACFKIGLVLLFGLLCVVAQKVADPNEWNLAKSVFLGLMRVLVAFYAFVVIINVAVSII